jgi:hypothetical protein
VNQKGKHNLFDVRCSSEFKSPSKAVEERWVSDNSNAQNDRNKFFPRNLLCSAGEEINSNEPNNNDTLLTDVTIVCRK